MSYYLFTNKTEGINIPFDCTFLKSGDYYYERDVFEINSNYQIYVKVDIRKLDINDTIGHVSFSIPTNGISQGTIFKVYETEQYTISSSLRYEFITNYDKEEKDIKDDVVIYNSQHNKIIKVDITKLVKKRLKGGYDYVNFRICNNSSNNITIYNPRNIDQDFVNAILYTPSATPKDSDNIGSAGTGEIDLKTRELKFMLPTFQTTSKLAPITFTGCYRYDKFGYLGHDFIANYEYEVQIELYRALITDYKGNETTFIKMTKEQALKEYNLTIPENITAYVNINDLSYFHIDPSDNNTYKIVYQNGSVVTIVLDKITYIKINELDWIKYNYTNSILTSITNSDNEVVEFDIYNGRIRTLFFIKQKKKVSFAYQTISGYAYLNYIRLYNYEGSKQYLISESKYERTSASPYRLNKVVDTTHKIALNYAYETSSNDVKLQVQQATLEDGLTSYKIYQYSSNENKATITNHYGKVSNIYFDDEEQIKIVQNDDKYITYQYQRNNKGEITRARSAIESNSHNILENGDFNIDRNSRPDSWSTTSLTTNDIITTNDFMPNILGSNIMKITNATGTEKKLYQSQIISGGEGDEWMFSVWAKGNFTSNTKLQVIISLRYPSIYKTKDYTFDFNSSDSDWQRLFGIVVAEQNYSTITITILYNGHNTAYIGNLQLYQGVSHNYYDYNKQGEVEGIKLGTNNCTYTYDDKKNIKEIKSSSGEIVNVNYNQRGQMTLLKDATSPQKVEYVYNSKGNNTSIKQTNADNKATQTQAIYDSNNNIIEETNERGYQTTYQYDSYLRPTESQMASGIASITSYNNIDEVLSSSSHLNSSEDGCKYEYNEYKNIKKITTKNDIVYEFIYDNYKRLGEIKLNGNSFQINNYNNNINSQNTDIITRKIYGSNIYNSYSFEYDDEQRLKDIYYSLPNYSVYLFTFGYNEDNQINTIVDHINNITKSYEYNTNGGLEKIVVNQNSTIKETYYYSYDNLNNVQKAVQQLDNLKRSFDYDYPYEYDDYSLNGYFNRINRSFMDDITRDADNALGIYGATPVLKLYETAYDPDLKINVIRLTKTKSTICYQADTINSKRDQTRYFGKEFDKVDWDNNFRNNKTIMMWLKPTGTYQAMNLMSLGISNWHNQVKLDNTGQLIFGYSTLETDLYLKLNEWNLLNLTFILQGEIQYITIGLNGDTFTTTMNTNIGIPVRCQELVIGNRPDSIDQEELNNNQGSILAMPIDIVFISMGAYIHTASTIQKIYQEGIKYLNGYKVAKASSVRYYNELVYQNIDVITLNGTLVSSNGLLPKEYSYTNKTYSFNKTKLFEYDDILKRHTYGSYDDYTSITEQRKSLLSYNLNLWAKGTISLWVKPSSKYRKEKRYIISSMQESINRVSLYIDDKNALFLEMNNDIIPSNLYLEEDKWNMVTIRWMVGETSIKVNNSAFRIIISDYQTLSNCTTYIGCTMDRDPSRPTIMEKVIPSYHLNGNLQMFSFINRYMSDVEITDIYNNGGLIDIRSIYDDNGRLKQKEISTKEKTLSKYYRYYEEDNNLNNLPTSEVSYNGEETVYSYDEAGNITHKATYNVSDEILEAYNYEYDDLKRLKKEVKYQNTNTFIYAYSYTYDNNGNIQSKTSLDSSGNVIYNDTYIYTSTIKDRLERIERLQNSVSTVISSFTYNSTNVFFPATHKKNNIVNNLVWEGRRLKSYGEYVYKYNENGVRISKKNSSGYGTDYVVEGSKVIASYADDNGIKRKIYYNYDSSSLLVGLHYGGNEYFYERDLTGNINKIIDKDGLVMVEYKYDAYGVPKAYTGALVPAARDNESDDLILYNIYLYKGYIYDYETGLYYNTTRYYDPEIGRFISPDDISYLDPSSIGGLNLYCYCLNNPIMYSDSDGHMPKWLQIGMIVAGAALAIGMIICTAGAASAGIAPLAFAYFGIAANTVYVGTMIAATVVSAGIAAFAAADIQQVVTNGNDNYLGFLGDSYDMIKGGFYMASMAFPYASQFAQPGWGWQKKGTQDAPMQKGPKYGTYTKITPKGNDVAVYNGRGQQIYRFDTSRLKYFTEYNMKLQHMHYYEWWKYEGKWRHKEIGLVPYF